LQLGQLPALAVLNVADNALEELPPGLSELKEKKLRELKLLPNPLTDPKVRCAAQGSPASRSSVHASPAAASKRRILTARRIPHPVRVQVKKIITNNDTVSKLVKELWKYLEGQKDGGGKGGRGGGKRK